MSWSGEVIADSNGKWSSNALRFATKEEAEGYVEALSLRWSSVIYWRVVESADPATHMWSISGDRLKEVTS
jgi:hypothetical protein